MKLKELLEEFQTGFKSYGEYFEIFVNPSRKEILEAGKETGSVRYIIDFKKKKLYVFSALLLHVDAANVLKIS